MKNLIKIILILVFSEQIIFAQFEGFSKHAQMKIDCKQCHLCDTPTKADPCLIQCPRYKIEPVRHSVDEAPDELVIDKVEAENDLYQEVNFTHRLHAEMSFMSGGCATCHHYNPPGKIVKCSNCHSTSRKRDILKIPDLKAAFHRQCISCHNTWEEKSECKNCHIPNSSKESLIKKDFSKTAHEKITEPKKVIYTTNSKEGEMVTFFHNDHTSLFNLDCTQCHTQESCANCHSQISRPTELTVDVHDKCSSCHDTDNNCSSCHMDKEANSFNHKSATNFDLRIYHSTVSCVQCHSSKGVFTGLKPKCENCHSKNGIYEHAITGLELDDIHSEFYCVNCHVNNNYKSKPTCIECHDDDVSFPTDLPGERINKR